MNWRRYKAEIELMEKQNDVEHDLYNIISNMLRERKAFSNVSLRDISSRKRTKSAKEKVFWGLKGFPDLVILDRNYEPTEHSVDRKYLYGVVEAKFVNKSICKQRDDKKQLWGHLLWFKKVIYTNGVEWRFYRADEKDVQRILESTTFLEKLQEDSYNKLAKKDIIYQEVDDVLDSICEKYCVEDLMECPAFILRKDLENGEKCWDKNEWNRLIKYLDEYSYETISEYILY